MNKFIEQELKKCKVADVEKISETQFRVRKRQKRTPKINSYYIIKLAPYIIHPSENFTLASNWNRGIVPKSEYLKCVVTQIMGKMVKVDGGGFDYTNKVDLNDSYIGLWLPSEGFEIKEEL